ncbi:ribose-5-phosphate isomerase RpiA [Jannaschia aquimarina]|uniref:Ribose-5-phosphate isomerase A n=1 Tax=Jannaschia aquimarina TaxID=935700 RepID=A0A0D1DCH8_9RHOB|nr:ribose-5-phosphate isomerase RpiA [Jannaschia aquimarina]KIT17688.1 Ribose-5-phosphate isomerase A [Jannaschia aquimarina]SNS79012.1 ribose-5-phosphate isomerase [Jannaschia aquimarina]
MSAKPNPIDMAKYVSARRAVDYVQDGMRVGLGTGSTAAWMVRCLGEMIREDGLRITGVPTSTRTADLARQCGVPVATLEDAKWLDLTIDGADEFDADLNLIKGGGGALLQEKIVATASDMTVIITDPSKEVASLGAFPLPVEVIPFGWQTTKALIEESLIGQDVDGRAVTLRLASQLPFRTDEGNLILDLHLRRIGNPRQLSLLLNQIPGVVENGLFLDIADVVICGRQDGTVEVRDVNHGTVTEETVDISGGENIFGSIAD